MTEPLQAPRSLAVLVLLVSAACSDGNSNTSGVSGSIKVTDVSDEQAEQVCEWAGKQAQDVDVSERQVCVSEIAPDSETASECRAAVDDCVEELSEEPAEPAELDCSGGVPDDLGPGCAEITVGDYEACLKSFIGQIEKVLNEVSCDRPGKEPNYAGTASSLPKACRTIITNCPQLLPGDLGDTDEGGDSSESDG